MTPYYTEGNLTLYCGDNLVALPEIPEDSVDFVVTDPPYLLSFMGKEWDAGKGDIPTNELVFRAWFAGLVAGEACFRIHREKGGGYYACEFSIKMRADEGPLLRALAKRLQAGSVQDIPAESRVVESAPAVKWVVHSREDCWKIARLLDGTPLYAKKQCEYDLWRKALQTWTDMPRGNRWHGPRDNSVMEALWNEMKTLRPFDEDLAASGFNPFGQPDYLFHYKWSRECLRVLKPGGFLLAFGGTRTYHRMICAIEDAGFDIRDCLMWCYGQGFPKSPDVGVLLDKAAGAKREVVGTKVGCPGYSLADHGRTNEVYGDLHNPAAECAVTAPATDLAKQWTGWANALKPAWEPVTVAMKPLDGTLAHNAATWGVAGINIKGSRVGTESTIRTRSPRSESDSGWVSVNRSPVGGSDCGRWPANLLLDEEAAAMLDEQTGTLKSGKMKAGQKRSTGKDGGYHHGFPETATADGTFGDSGGASRFFYVAKANRKERNPPGMKNDHPTVKPLKLMEYLLTMFSTPTGGVILDPFAGSGSTMLAAKRLGRPCIGIELSEHNCEIAKNRIQSL